MNITQFLLVKATSLLFSALVITKGPKANFISTSFVYIYILYNILVRPSAHINTILNFLRKRTGLYLLTRDLASQFCPWDQTLNRWLTKKILYLKMMSSCAKGGVLLATNLATIHRRSDLSEKRGCVRFQLLNIELWTDPHILIIKGHLKTTWKWAMIKTRQQLSPISDWHLVRRWKCLCHLWSSRYSHIQRISGFILVGNCHAQRF